MAKDVRKTREGREGENMKDDLFAQLWNRAPWNTWQIKNSGTQSPKNTELSVSDGTFAEWLRNNGSQSGTMSEITYFTCLKTLSETMGKLPWKIYKRTETGITESDEDDVRRVLKLRPNPYTTPTIFWSTVELNRNHYGNAYVYVERKFDRKKYGGEYKIANLWIMPSPCVKVLVDDAGVFANAGKIWYLYTDPYSHKQMLFERGDVMHYTTSHTFNGLVGKPVQEILAETLSGNRASQEYLNALYEQGLSAKAVLEYTGEMSEPAKTALRDAIETFATGSANAGRILPIPIGMKLTPLDIKLTDAQYYELRKYNSLQIASAFGVKPNQLNDYEKSSYANSETQQLSFLTDTALFIIKQYEEETGAALLGEDKIVAGEYVKLNEKVLLRTDSKTQMEIFKAGTECGVTLINEARADLDRPRVEGGDEAIVNGTMTPLRIVQKKIDTSTTTMSGS